MDAEQPPGVGIGPLLESLRREKGFTKLSLADASGVSATYIAMIEGGIDSRTGKEIRPSPDTLRKLSGALARGTAGEGRRLYTEMMAVLGYLPEDDTATASRDPALLPLRDPRLDEHFRPTMESWHLLSEEEQAAVLVLFRLIDRSRRRR